MICEGCGQAAISTTKAGSPICPDCIDEGYGDECYAPAIGEGSQMSDELNVWAAAVTANTETDDDPYGASADAASAVIRTYGDKRYQQAIADVVEWLGSDGVLITARAVARRFGKDA